MYPFLQLGPVALPTKAFLYLLGMWWSLSLLEWTAVRRALPAAQIYQAAVISVASGLAAARLAFIAQNWSAYANNWLAMLWPLHEGYQPPLGFVVAIGVAILALRAYQLPLAAVGDAAVPALASLLILHALTDWLAGPGLGQASPWPWLPQHPVQLYEMILAAGLWLIWWRTNGQQPFVGWSLAFVMGGYSFGRIFLLTFRANLWFTATGWPVAQWVYLLLLCGAWGWLAWHTQPPAHNNLVSSDEFTQI